MEKQKISIIVPIYNVEKYIKRCAESLFNQTYTNLEYIFVNDCSTDGSIDVLNQVIEEYQNLKSLIYCYVHNENRGLAAARNTGVQHATGDYILHIDSDDWIDLNTCEDMLNEALVSEADIVWCDMYKDYTNRKEYLRCNYSVDSEFAIKKMLVTTVWGVAGKLIKRSLIVDNNLQCLDGVSTYEDGSMLIPALYYSKKNSYIPNAYYHYWQSNSSSLTQSLNTKKIKKMMSDKEMVINYLTSFFQFHRCYDKYCIELMALKLHSKKILLYNEELRDLDLWRSLYNDSHKYIFKIPYTRFYVKLEYWLFANRLYVLGKLSYRIRNYIKKLG